MITSSLLRVVKLQFNLVYYCNDIHVSLEKSVHCLLPSLCAAPQLNKLPLIQSNLEEDPEGVRQAFHTYLGHVVQSLSESREREEMSIIA